MSHLTTKGLDKNSLEYYWRRIFEVGVFVKFLNGVWETVLGAVVLLIGKNKFVDFFSFLARGEIIQHPHDRLLGIGTHAIQASSGAKTFIGLYFLIHGVANLFLSIQLYRNKFWAYLVTIGVMTVFVVYQVYRIFLYHSGFLVIVTIYDIFFAFLTWHEYLYQTKNNK